jgi:arsenite methyltransferase
MTSSSSADEIRDAVRERYAGAAREAQSQRRASCGCDSGPDISDSQLYEISQIQGLPDGAVLASLGCGNPTLLAQLNPGEVVLDLGSGGGIDVLLSAKRVGPTGKAYGLDMTDEMLELARSNTRQAGATNVEFLKGQIEAIPLPDDSVDVIISNCVINLSADKDAVLKEAFRVLKPGGRFAVADIVVQGGPLPEAVRKVMALWAGCVAGALSEDEYRSKLALAGFTGIEMETLTVYSVDDVPEEVSCCVPDGLALPEGTRVVSAFVRATKGESAEKPASKPSAMTISAGAPATAKVQASSCCSGSGSSASSCCGSTVKSYFKDVASQWDSMRKGYFTEEVREAAIARANLTADSVVADVGTGTGFMLAGIAPLVGKAYGFDNSPEMLDVARKNLGSAANVELGVSEGESLPLPDGAVDAVFANMYLHHATTPAQAIAEMVRVLKPGGRLVITDLDRHNHYWMAMEMADIWLGFEQIQVEEWLAEAGLADVKVECTGSDCCGSSAAGDQAEISVFVASGTRV